MAEPGDIVGQRYEVIRKIAAGGMGTVYEARHTLSRRSVALKVLNPQIARGEAATQRFLREVSAPAQIGHDGIVEVLDAGVDPQNGSLFVAMELLLGETLTQRVGSGTYPRERVLDAFEELLEALSAAHGRGFVHRDLKPDNVFVARQRDGRERIKILDFGIARDSESIDVTMAGTAMGTPDFMSPEQATSAKDVTAATDVWAVGVMLYWALSGKLPFQGPTSSAIVVEVLTRPATPVGAIEPSIPGPLAELVDRCLSKDPAERPKDAGALLAELREARRRTRGVPATAAPFDDPMAQSGLGALGGEAAAGGAGGAAIAASSAPLGHGSVPGGSGTGGTHGRGDPRAPGPGPFGATPSDARAFAAEAAPIGALPTPAHPASLPSGGGFAAGPTAARGGRSLLPWALGCGLLGLLGGGLAIGAAVLWPDPPRGPDPIAPPPAGQVRITTDVQGAELWVDGVPAGPVASGQLVPLGAGTHALEVRLGGVLIGRTQVGVPGAGTVDAALGRPVRAVDGALIQGDPRLRSGEFVDEFLYNWPAGAPVRLEVQSTQFDSYLILRPPTGRQLDNDDPAPGQTNAVIETVTAETGTYGVRVTTSRPGEQGAYRLIVTAPLDFVSGT